jgi:hypothetical protein
LPLREPTPSERSEAVDLARADLAATIGRLRVNLKPHNLIDEFTRDSRLRDVAAMSGLDRALQRRPLAMLLLAAGGGLLLFSRSRRLKAGVDGRGTIGATIASLAGSAANVVRERARAGGQAASATAQNLVATGTARLCDAVEDQVDDLIDGMPGSADSRLLVKSAVQIAIVAAVEALLRSRLLTEPAE